MKEITLVFNHKTFTYINKDSDMSVEVTSEGRYANLLFIFKTLTGEDLHETQFPKTVEKDFSLFHLKIDKLDEFIDMLNGLNRDQLCCLNEVIGEEDEILWVNNFQYNSLKLSNDYEKAQAIFIELLVKWSEKGLIDKLNKLDVFLNSLNTLIENPDLIPKDL